MARIVNYEIIEETDACVLLRDIGPWHKYLTITNGAEGVVKAVAPMLRGRRLEYYDSEGDREQLIVKDGEFAGFAAARNSTRDDGAIAEDKP